MSDAPVVQALPSELQGVRRMLVRDASGQMVEVVEAGATRAGRLPQGGVFAPFQVEEGRIVLGPPLRRKLAELKPSPGAVMAVAGAVLRDLATLHATGGAHGALDGEGWGFGANGVFQVRPTLHLPARPGTPTEADVAAVGQVVAALAPTLADEPGWERARFWLRGMGVGSDRVGFADARAAWQAWQALVGRRALGGELGAALGPAGLKMPVPARGFAVRPVAGGQMRAQVLARDKAAADARAWVLKELERHRAERYQRLSERLEARAMAEVRALVATPEPQIAPLRPVAVAVAAVEEELVEGVLEDAPPPDEETAEVERRAAAGGAAIVGATLGERAGEDAGSTSVEAALGGEAAPGEEAGGDVGSGPEGTTEGTEDAEKAERERLAAEQARAEQLEAERRAAETAAAEKAAADQAEAERREQERLEAERLAAETAAAERAEAERQERERERLEAERLAAETAAAERAAAERAEAERRAAEIAAAERAAAERAEAERREQERLEAERLAAETAAAERAAAEQAEAERLATEIAAAERAEAGRREQERLEAERLAAEKAEAERLAAEKAAAEKAEADRRERERLESERLAAEKAEAARRERERLDAERAAAERAAAEAAEAERRAADDWAPTATTPGVPLERLEAGGRARTPPLPVVDPTTVPEPIDGWVEAPRWSGAVGVTGDRAREAEKGPGKWVEQGRSPEELAASLPQGPTRPLSLEEPKARGLPPWVFPVAAVVALLILAAVVFLG